MSDDSLLVELILTSLLFVNIVAVVAVLLTLTSFFVLAADVVVNPVAVAVNASASASVDVVVNAVAIADENVNIIIARGNTYVIYQLYYFYGASNIGYLFCSGLSQSRTW